LRHGLSPGGIAVLAARSTSGHAVLRNGTIGGYGTCLADEAREDVVVFDTVRRFKGLERPAVILVDGDDLVDAELAYVGLSRPSVWLAVLGSGPVLARLRGELGD
jgi:hypothetical protein